MHEGAVWHDGCSVTCARRRKVSKLKKNFQEDGPGAVQNNDMDAGLESVRFRLVAESVMTMMLLLLMITTIALLMTMMM